MLGDGRQLSANNVAYWLLQSNELKTGSNVIFRCLNRHVKGTSVGFSNVIPCELMGSSLQGAFATQATSSIEHVHTKQQQGSM